MTSFDRVHSEALHLSAVGSIHLIVAMRLQKQQQRDSLTACSAGGGRCTEVKTHLAKIVRPECLRTTRANASHGQLKA